MTRRCSVMRMPVAAQRASMPDAWDAEEGLSPVMCCLPDGALSPSMLRHVTSHQKRVQLFPVGLLIVAFAASDHHESGSVVEPPCRLVVLFDFQKYRAHAAPREVAEMGHQQRAGEAAAAMGLIDRHRQDLRFVR